MRTWTLGCLCGAFGVSACAHLPAIFISVICILAGTIATLGNCFYYSRIQKPHFISLHAFYFISALFFGFGWTSYQANHEWQHILSKTQEGKTLTLTGQITGLPEVHAGLLHFTFTTRPSAPQELSQKIRLSWYQPSQMPNVGEHWQFTVRLTLPHGLMNPGGFDYEKWLFEQHIHAVGYVVNTQYNQKLHDSEFYIIDRIRQSIDEHLTTLLPQAPLRGLLAALTIGSRAELSSDQWEILQNTGTNHLMAIAGLHIGFVSGFLFFMVQWLWRWIPRACLYIPAQQVGACAALIAGVFYSALAGFLLPTQRAILMIAFFLCGQLLKRPLPPWQSWFLALLFLLLYDPLLVLSDSFALSFGAVAMILYGTTYRLSSTHGWKHSLRLQGFITLGLIPLTLLFFHQTALLGLFANAIAIPWVGFLVLPPALLGCLFIFIHAHTAHLLLFGAEKSLEILWNILSFFAHVPNTQWMQYLPNTWILTSTCIGILFLLAPQGMPTRWLGILWCLPLIFFQAPAPPENTVWFTLLDVGQGLSAVIRTAHHTLVYDTGPKFTPDFDMGKAVVVPYLRQANIHHLDMLLISHGDNDHRGGAESVLVRYPHTPILTSVPNLFPGENAIDCHEQQQWHWDGVTFTILYPPADQLNRNNDSSCVLRVEIGNHALLLPGDIEKWSEHYLLAHSAILKSDLVVAPHHGSKTSSTPSFIEAIQPNIVLFPVGYRNRFHFPSDVIVTRYLAAHAKTFDTVNDGAMTWEMNTAGLCLKQRYRVDEHHYWNA